MTASIERAGGEIGRAPAAAGARSRDAERATGVVVRVRAR
jgi:hypothetical protein